MRIALALVIALAAAGCAKKSKPAVAPAAQEIKAAEPPPGAAPADAPDKSSTGGTPLPGDPCDGGETKNK